jgi:tetratricopeptide (TPR) repeat protein
MTAAPDASPPTPRAALDAARVVFGNAAAAPALWSAAQHVLQQVIARPSLTGQALVAEVRQQGAITLSDAHALVALATWADRSAVAATNESERLIAREAWMALDHAVANAAAPRVAAPVSPFAPPVPGATAAPSPWGAAAAAGAAGAAGGKATATNAPALDPANEVAATAPHRRRFLLALSALVVIAVGAAGWVWWYSGRAGREFHAGAEAYRAGSREAARVAFAKAAQLDPNDARPLIYLGRISREEGDLARARRFLTTAVRVAPGSSLAARELAALMLADGQPEIARRFYVRALEIDPADRTAQGFLGCALYRLQRYDEARRWVERAGPGEWQPCAPPLPPPAPGPYGAPGYPPPPPA